MTVWSIGSRLRAARHLAILAFALLGAAPVAASDRPFGLVFDDPAITGQPLSNTLIRTVRANWSREHWPYLRVVHASEPLPQLRHYIARIAPGKGICALTAISDPYEPGDAELKMRPILRKIADELEILHGSYYNSYDQVENETTGAKQFSSGRLTLNSWERMDDQFEVKNWQSTNLATWPRKTDEALSGTVSRAWLQVISDSDRRLRAAVRMVRRGDC